MGATQHHFLGVDWHLRDVLAWFGALVVPTSAYLVSADFVDGQLTESARQNLNDLAEAVIKLKDFAPAPGSFLGPKPLAAVAADTADSKVDRPEIFLRGALLRPFDTDPRLAGDTHVAHHTGLIAVAVGRGVLMARLSRSPRMGCRSSGDRTVNIRIQFLIDSECDDRSALGWSRRQGVLGLL